MRKKITKTYDIIKSMPDNPDIKMIADYMENGFLENIIDMFRHDRNLFKLLGSLMADERNRVRLGVIALVEALKPQYYGELIKTIPDIAKNLKSQDAIARADAVYLMEVIGHESAIPYLKELLNDENILVREITQDAIIELSQK
ncbi:MAG: hypothetical protein HY756_03445 [Nitrospirae bacterium]|nr:hypothetical protein [Nitrospirota bacterium]